jgi:hypothetical protein
MPRGMRTVSPDSDSEDDYVPRARAAFVRAGILDAPQSPIGEQRKPIIIDGLVMNNVTEIQDASLKRNFVTS